MEDVFDSRNVALLLYEHIINHVAYKRFHLI